MESDDDCECDSCNEQEETALTDTFDFGDVDMESSKDSGRSSTPSGMWVQHADKQDMEPQEQSSEDRAVTYDAFLRPLLSCNSAATANVGDSIESVPPLRNLTSIFLSSKPQIKNTLLTSESRLEPNPHVLYSHALHECRTLPGYISSLLDRQFSKNEIHKGSSIVDDSIDYNAQHHSQYCVTASSPLQPTLSTTADAHAAEGVHILSNIRPWNATRSASQCDGSQSVYTPSEEATHSSQRFKIKYAKANMQVQVQFSVKAEWAVEEEMSLLVPCLERMSVDTLSTWCLVDDGGRKLRLPRATVHLGHQADEITDQAYAELTYNTGTDSFTLKDMGLPDGTYVNERRLAVEEYVTLCSMDTLRFGYEPMMYRMEKMPEGDTEPPSPHPPEECGEERGRGYPPYEAGDCTPRAHGHCACQGFVHGPHAYGPHAAPQQVFAPQTAPPSAHQSPRAQQVFSSQTTPPARVFASQTTPPAIPLDPESGGYGQPVRFQTQLHHVPQPYNSPNITNTHGYMSMPCGCSHAHFVPPSHAHLPNYAHPPSHAHVPNHTHPVLSSPAHSVPPSPHLVQPPPHGYCGGYRHCPTTLPSQAHNVPYSQAYASINCGLPSVNGGIHVTNGHPQMDNRASETFVGMHVTNSHPQLSNHAAETSCDGDHSPHVVIDRPLLNVPTSVQPCDIITNNATVNYSAHMALPHNSAFTDLPARDSAAGTTIPSTIHPMTANAESSFLDSLNTSNVSAPCHPQGHPEHSYPNTCYSNMHGTCQHQPYTVRRSEPIQCYPITDSIADTGVHKSNGIHDPTYTGIPEAIHTGIQDAAYARIQNANYTINAESNTASDATMPNGRGDENIESNVSAQFGNDSDKTYEPPSSLELSKPCPVQNGLSPFSPSTPVGPQLHMAPILAGSNTTLVGSGGCEASTPDLPEYAAAEATHSEPRTPDGIAPEGLSSLIFPGLELTDIFSTILTDQQNNTGTVATPQTSVAHGPTTNFTLTHEPSLPTSLSPSFEPGHVMMWLHDVTSSQPQERSIPATSAGGDTPFTQTDGAQTTAFTIHFGDENEKMGEKPLSKFLPRKVRKSFKTRSEKLAEKLTEDKDAKTAADTCQGASLDKYPSTRRGYYSDGQQSSVSSDCDDASTKSDIAGIGKEVSVISITSTLTTLTTQDNLHSSPALPRDQVHTVMNKQRESRVTSNTRGLNNNVDQIQTNGDEKQHKKHHEKQHASIQKLNDESPAKYLIDKMLNSGPKTPTISTFMPSTIESRLQTHTLSNVTSLSKMTSLTHVNEISDNTSESGTYIIEYDRSEELEEARRSIDFVFGVNSFGQGEEWPEGRDDGDLTDNESPEIVDEIAEDEAAVVSSSPPVYQQESGFGVFEVQCSGAWTGDDEPSGPPSSQTTPRSRSCTTRRVLPKPPYVTDVTPIPPLPTYSRSSSIDTESFLRDTEIAIESMQHRENEKRAEIWKKDMSLSGALESLRKCTSSPLCKDLSGSPRSRTKRTAGGNTDSSSCNVTTMHTRGSTTWRVSKQTESDSECSSCPVISSSATQLRSVETGTEYVKSARSRLRKSPTPERRVQDDAMDSDHSDTSAISSEFSESHNLSEPQRTRRPSPSPAISSTRPNRAFALRQARSKGAETPTKEIRSASPRETPPLRKGANAPTSSTRPRPGSVSSRPTTHNTRSSTGSTPSVKDSPSTRRSTSRSEPRSESKPGIIRPASVNKITDPSNQGKLRTSTNSPLSRSEIGRHSLGAGRVTPVPVVGRKSKTPEPTQDRMSRSLSAPNKDSTPQQREDYNAWKRRKGYDPRKAVAEARAKRAATRGGGTQESELESSTQSSVVDPYVDEDGVYQDDLFLPVRKSDADSPVKEMSDEFLMSSLLTISLKLKEQMEGITRRLNVHETVPGVEGVSHPGPVQLTSTLANLRHVEAHLNCAERVLFPRMALSPQHSVDDHHEYIRELELIRAEITGFKPIPSRDMEGMY